MESNLPTLRVHLEIQNQPEAAPMFSPPADMKIVASDGDVIFQVGQHDPAKTMLVSSKVLASHSRVFNAMLNGSWAESQKVSRASPGICTFPDDDAENFLWLCELMHQHQLSEEIPSVELSILYEFTELCDKYDCTAVAREQAKIWVLDLLSQTFRPENCDLLWITYIFDLWEEFHSVSIHLIMELPDRYRVEAGWEHNHRGLKDYAAEWNPMPDELKGMCVSTAV